MNFITIKKSFSLLAFAFLLALAPGVQAEENPNAPAENAGLTQGQAAMIVARRLGLVTNAGDFTQARAIQLLAARGISPKGGWNAGAAIESGDVAVIFVQALGLESELTEAQIVSGDSQAYSDLLVEKFDLDVSALNGNDDLASGFDSVAANNTSGQPTPFTRQNLRTAFEAVSDGGSGGGSTSKNSLSPSAP